MRGSDALTEHLEQLSSNADAAGQRTRDQLNILSRLGGGHLQNLAATLRDNAEHFQAEFEQIAAAFAVGDPQAACAAYQRDFLQRSVLFLDTLRERGDAFNARGVDDFKPLLIFEYDIVVDARQFDRPANYALVRIRPPEGFPEQRDDGRPWVIIDPRAGHGAGIGGFKHDSEVGMALSDGHPVYFVIFFPHPEPGQTLAEVCHAEAAFLKYVREQHPRSPNPLITGNCQGGWASMILAALYPDLTGPMVIAGAPLSYWAGELGKNPFRYMGGVAGGAAPAALLSDLGSGQFDGAHLILNFEMLKPGKTWWRKHYDLFSNVDSEAPRFLEFEAWWSGFYFMSEAEIRWIVENLFIGNRLVRGEASLNDGTQIDLTRVKSPIVIFASHGDDITPPQQALNWIADLYPSIQELRAHGQVIVYTLHDSIGHLGIFVSASVAREHHKEISSVLKTIETLSPGLYEMLISEYENGFVVSFENRTIEDILKMDDGRDEEVEFAAVAHFSEWLVKTYEVFFRPAVKALVSPAMSREQVRLHPMRLQRSLVSSENPLLEKLPVIAQEARQARTPAGPENPFIRLERLGAETIERSLDFMRDVRDAGIELWFHSLYATPWMRAVGESLPARELSHETAQFPQVQEVMEKAAIGGYPAAIVRMLVLLSHARESIRREKLERSSKILYARPPFDTMPQEHRTQLLREQTMIVEFGGDRALETLNLLLRDDVDRIRAINLVFDITGPVEQMDDVTIAMFRRLQATLRQMARNWNDPALHGGHTAISGDISSNIPSEKDAAE